MATSGSAWNDLAANTKAKASEVMDNFDWAQTNLFPHKSGSMTDGVYDVGSGSFRFKNVHLSGIAYVGDKIGIGTTSPSDVFETKATSPHWIQEDDVVSTKVYFAHVGDLAYWSSNRRPANAVFSDPSKASSEIVLGSANASSDIRFFTANFNNSNPSVRMTLDKDGNLGIGTAPSSKFAVAGNARIDNTMSCADLDVDNPMNGHTRVFLSAEQTGILSETNTKIEFDSEEFDIGDNFSTTTNRYVAPNNGVYEIHMRVKSRLDTAVAGIIYSAYIYKDGTEYSSFIFTRDATKTTAQINITDLIQLSVGSFIEGFFSHDVDATNATLLADTDGTCMFVHRVL